MPSRWFRSDGRWQGPSCLMIQLQQNRYLWVHVVSLAALPLLIDVCLAGLASAGPALAFGGQFWVIALLGVLPGLAMQWLRPFYVFSLPPLALKPAALSEDQRRCLTIFQSWQIKALAVAVALFSVWLLGKIYGLLPQISPLLTPKAGLICGAVAFFWVATFMQIAVSAMRALLIGPDALKRVKAIDEGAIASTFLMVGLPVGKLLPDSPTTDTSEKAEPERKQPLDTDVRAASEKENVIEKQTQARAANTAPEATVIPETTEETLSHEPIDPEPIDPEKLEELAGTEKLEKLEDTAADSEELELIIPETLPPQSDRKTL